MTSVSGAVVGGGDPRHNSVGGAGGVGGIVPMTASSAETRASNAFNSALVTSPGGPGSPTGPAGPAGPVAPVGPTAPAGPVAPVAPGAPSDPAGPGLPLGPATPGGPSGPRIAQCTGVSASTGGLVLHDPVTPTIRTTFVSFPMQACTWFGSLLSPWASASPGNTASRAATPTGFSLMIRPPSIRTSGK